MVTEFTLLCGAIASLLHSMEEIKMPKTKISDEQKVSETKYLKEHEPFSNPDLKNSDFVAEVLLDCIKSGELDSFRDVLTSYLSSINKTELAKKAGIGRRTLYELIDTKKDFNPELSTISAIIRAIAA